MFWGTCLPNLGPSAIWYQRERQANGKWKSSVYAVEVSRDALWGRFLSPMPPVGVSLKLVKAGKCQELAGEEMSSEP